MAQNNTAAAGSAAVIILEAGGGEWRNQIGGIAWSYSGTPTNGRLEVTHGGGTVLNLDITAEGPGYIPFAISSNPLTAVTVTLDGAGTAVVGKLNIWGDAEQ